MAHSAIWPGNIAAIGRPDCLLCRYPSAQTFSESKTSILTLTHRDAICAAGTRSEQEFGDYLFKCTINSTSRRRRFSNRCL